MPVGKRVQASQWKESLLGSEAARFAGARPYLLPGSETKSGNYFKICPRMFSKTGSKILMSKFHKSR